MLTPKPPVDSVKLFLPKYNSVRLLANKLLSFTTAKATIINAYRNKLLKFCRAIEIPEVAI